MLYSCKISDAAPSSTSATQAADTQARFLSSQNPALVKRNVLASFTDILLLPVTIVPRTVGAVVEGARTGANAAVNGISMLNPQRWGGINGSGSGGRAGMGGSSGYGAAGDDYSGGAALFEVEDDDDEGQVGKTANRNSLRSSIDTTTSSLGESYADQILSMLNFLIFSSPCILHD